MALYAYAEMNNAQLVTAAVKFDQEQKEYKKNWMQSKQSFRAEVFRLSKTAM